MTYMQHDLVQAGRSISDLGWVLTAWRSSPLAETQEALGSFPQWPRDARGCSCVLCRPWELGAWSQTACTGGDGDPSWEVGSPDSQGVRSQEGSRTKQM